MGVKNIQGELQVNGEVVATQDWAMQYIADNFTTLMQQYLNSEAAAGNKPTAADISEVFNEEEEA